tara:strand:+ start:171 stop:353 length:183 start_codon:yes stop_codon:yes gene_type:complete
MSEFLIGRIDGVFLSNKADKSTENLNKKIEALSANSMLAALNIRRLKKELEKSQSKNPVL